MAVIMECPVCEQEVRSDATIKEYCALCGMSTKEEYKVTKVFGEEIKHFCCKSCKEKFTEFYNHKKR